MKARLKPTATITDSKFELYQGEDKTLIIGTNEDLTTYTQIEFVIDSPRQIKKTLTGGGISGVTASQFSVQIDAADTKNVNPGRYKYQTRATSSGSKTYHGKTVPNGVRVLHSSFVNPTNGNDYR